jgi:hypothetical protein
MKKAWLGMVCVSLGLSLSAVACGDDESDDEEDGKVSIQAPGVDVKAKGLLGAAGAAAPAKSE